MLVMVAVPHLDLVGSQLVMELRATLAKQGIALQVAEARDAICDALKRAGGERTIDFSTAKLSLSEAIAAVSGAGVTARSRTTDRQDLRPARASSPDYPAAS